MFYVYEITKGLYVTTNGLTIGKTKNINKAAYWVNKKHAKSWETSVKDKFPMTELKKATLKISE